MGKAANTYGFYGEDANQTSAGEVLTLADGEEAWVFHIQSGPHELKLELEAGGGRAEVLELVEDTEVVFVRPQVLVDIL